MFCKKNKLWQPSFFLLVSNIVEALEQLNYLHYAYNQFEPTPQPPKNNNKKQKQKQNKKNTENTHTHTHTQTHTMHRLDITLTQANKYTFTQN